MTESVTSTPGKKKNPFLRALTDLIILALLLVGAGGGGYFWGIHQQLAPIAKVPPGTPGAIAPSVVAPPKDPAEAAKKGTGAAAAATTEGSAPAAAHSDDGGAAEAPKSKKKYWVTSSGSDYIGYQITIKVNNTPVDSFFGPGKLIDISNLVKQGENTIVFDAKELGEQYNKHSGDAAAKLSLQLVSGAHISDSFKKSDVLLSYQRTAADTDDATETMQFTGE